MTTLVGTTTESCVASARSTSGTKRPRIAASTQMASWTLRHKGPSESKLADSGKTPFML